MSRFVLEHCDKSCQSVIITERRSLCEDAPRERGGRLSKDVTVSFDGCHGEGVCRDILLFFFFFFKTYLKSKIF